MQFTQKKYITPTPKPEAFTSGNGDTAEVTGYFQKTTRGQADCDLIFTGDETCASHPKHIVF